MTAYSPHCIKTMRKTGCVPKTKPLLCLVNCVCQAALSVESSIQSTICRFISFNLNCAYQLNAAHRVAWIKIGRCSYTPSPVPPSGNQCYLYQHLFQTRDILFHCLLSLPLILCSCLCTRPVSIAWQEYHTFSVGMLTVFLITICEIITNLLQTVLRALIAPFPEPAEFVVVPYLAHNMEVMEDHVSLCQLASKQLKDRFLDALKRNNEQEVLTILQTTNIDINTVLEVEDVSMVLASYKQGYWLPGYKLEKSWAMGLHVCVMYNALETAHMLLQQGAAIDRMPNGKTPLHVACEVSHGDCVALLLAHGAKVNSVSLSGHTPLHYCITTESVDCAMKVILKGGKVDMASRNNDADTPLHTAARFGIPELAVLYLAHGAPVDTRNARQETPLMTAAFYAFDAKEQMYSEDHHLVCRILLDHQADPNLHEEDHKTALHKAAWNCDHVLMHILLEAGADTQAMDINGCAPIQYLIKVTDVRPMAVPELCYQLLLNFNAPRIYPPQFHKVLQACYDFPKAIEILINSYEHIKATIKWRAAIPDDCYKRYGRFYDSLFTVCGNTPRSLFHLTRCAIRATLGKSCQTAVGQLPLPSSLKKYLLLQPEGIMY